MQDERFFPIKIATNIGRISHGQAAAWAKSGFFVPSILYSTDRRPYSYLYSFSDLVALRVISILRGQHRVSLADTRLVADHIRSATDTPWSELRFWVKNRRAFLEEPDGESASVVKLDAIASSVKEEADQLWYRSPEDYGQVERKRNVMHGALVVKGTRIPVSTVVALVDAGWDVERIRRGYPTLHPEDIQGVMRYVEEHQQVA